MSHASSADPEGGPPGQSPPGPIAAGEIPLLTDGLVVAPEATARTASSSRADLEPSSAPSESMLGAGAVLGRLYRVHRLIGRGAQGEVYEVEHLNMGTRFAAKVLNREFANDAELMTRLQREAKTASQLDHPNIARVVNFDTTEDGRSFVVMELLLGESLEARIQRGPMSIGEVASVGAEVAGALSAAHARGVVHRDVKPANVFLADTSIGRVTKVMDFGIAKVSREAEDIKLTRAGCVVGTPAYMAPEQVSGEHPVDHRADIYALGGMMFEMLCGRPPFVADTVLDVLLQHVRDPVPSVRTFRTDVPLKLEGILRQCLAKDPEHRFQTMDELARELHGVPTGPARRAPSLAPHAGPAPLPRPVSTPARLPPPSRVELGLDLKLPDTEARAKNEVRRNIQLAAVLAGVLAVWLVGGRIVKAFQRPEAPAAVTVDIMLVSVPPGADVFLRGQRMGTTPFVFPLRIGSVGIPFDLKLPGYQDSAISIVPDRNRTESVTLVANFRPEPPPVQPRRTLPLDQGTEPAQPVSSAPAIGFLTIQTEIMADIYVDGRPAGRTPLERLELSPGKHKVNLRGRKGESRALEVNVEVNAESTYNLNLGWGERRSRDWNDSSSDWEDRSRKRYSR